MKILIIVLLLFTISCNEKDLNNINQEEKIYNSISNEHFENNIKILDDTIIIEIHSKLTYVDSSVFILIVDYLLNEIIVNHSEFKNFNFKFLYFSSIEKRFECFIEKKNVELIILPFIHPIYKKIAEYIINKLWMNNILDYTIKLYEYYSYLNIKDEEMRSFTNLVFDGFQECLYSDCEGVNNTILNDLLTFYTDEELSYNEEKANKLRELIKLIRSAKPKQKSKKLIEI